MRTYKIIFLCIAILSLSIFSFQAFTALPYHGHDDGLFMKLSNNILSGQWLGDYDNLTLAKGSFYPIFVALSSLIGLPLNLTQSLLYFTSGYIFYITTLHLSSLRLSKNHKFSSSFFILLSIGSFLYLLNPFFFSLSRLSRDQLYGSLSILIISLFSLFIYLIQYCASFNKIIVTSLTQGLVIALFLLTREEGIWLIPSIFILCTYTIYCLRINSNLSLKQKITVSLAFVISFLLPYFMVSFANFHSYGVFYDNEVKESTFQNAYTSLVRIKEKNWNQYTPVPREVRNIAYSISPTFQELKPYLESSILNTWGSLNLEPDGCSSDHIDCDIRGGWFLWALRDAVSMAGYTSALQAHTFYERLYNDINGACSNHTISCEIPSPLARFNLRAISLKLWLSDFMISLKNLLKLNIYNKIIRFSDSDINSNNIYHNLTHQLLRPNSQTLEIVGYAFLKDKSGFVFQSDAIIREYDFLSSPDISDRYEDPDLLNSRFRLTFRNCNQSCSLNILGLDSVMYFDAIIDPIKGKIDTIYKSEKLNFSIEIFNINNELEYSRDVSIQKINKILQKIYSFIYSLIGIILLGLFLVQTCFCIYTKCVSSVTVINFSIFLAIISRTSILSLINISSFKTFLVTYYLPSIIFTIAFTYITLVNTLVLLDKFGRD